MSLKHQAPSHSFAQASRSPLAGRPAAPAGGGWNAPVFVWSIWALMVLAGLMFVRQFDSYLPWMDNWEIIPTATGEEPVTLSWLWRQHGWWLDGKGYSINEWRWPLGKIILLVLCKMTGCDFRAGAAFTVLVMAGLALAMIRTAKGLRGKTTYADAFFPLILLSWAYAFAFTYGQSAAGALPHTALSCILLCFVARNGSLFSLRVGLAFGICLMLLALTGPGGLGMIPPLALGLAYAGVLHWRSPEPGGKRRGSLHLALTALALLLIPAYFLGWQATPEANQNYTKSVGVAAAVAVDFLMQPLGGNAVNVIWPYSGLIFAGLVVASLVVLVVMGRQQPRERFRVVQLFVFVGALGVLALGFGWARAGSFGNGIFDVLGEAPDLSGYALLSPALICALYFIWSCHRGPAKHFVPMSLFTIAAFLAGFNTVGGIEYGKGWKTGFEPFENDLAAGMPPSFLAARYARFCNIETYNANDPQDFGEVYMTARLKMLHRAHFRRYQLLQDPPLQEIPVLPHWIVPTGMSWDPATGTGQPSADSPYLTVTLPQPRFVYGLRLRCSYQNPGTAPALQLDWKEANKPEINGATLDSVAAHPQWDWTAGTEGKVVVWLNATVEQFRIFPGCASGDFHIAELVLVVPANEAIPSPGS